jgi:hypothetical protein
MRVGEDKTLTLKSGEVVNAREAVCEYEELTRHVSKNPDHIAVLRAIADGRTQGHAIGSVAFLKRMGYLDHMGDIRRPLAGRIVQCSVVDTPEGQVLVNPFKFKDESDRQLVDAIVGSFLTFSQTIRKLLHDDPDGPLGRG